MLSRSSLMSCAGSAKLLTVLAFMAAPLFYDSSDCILVFEMIDTISKSIYFRDILSKSTRPAYRFKG